MLEVALAGNPNTGKTTLFNALTGARARVGNYPGITVEKRSGTHTTADGKQWQVHDLPGTYSLTAHSPEEEIAHHALTGRIGDLRADVAVVVLDASNLARNLLLLLQIAEMDRPVVAALNLMDAAEAEGLKIDVPGLQAALGCPLVPMVARRGEGIGALEQAVREVTDDPRRGRVAPTPWPDDVRAAMAKAREVLGPLTRDKGDGEVLWWLTTDPQLVDALEPGLGQRLLAAVPRKTAEGVDIRRRVTELRYARIDDLVVRYVRRDGKRQDGPSERIDRWALHPWLGPLLFLVAMALLFQAVFAWAQPAMDAVTGLMDLVAGLLGQQLPDGLLRDVLIDGVLAGIGGTLVFLPQIVMLFLGIALLEDTGYLARAAFVVDRLMARVGLPGKAFVPLLSAYACAVPGIMAARTMGDPRDRLLTILVAPLMSCSARLPVYTLVTAAVFAGSMPVLGFLSLGGLVVAGMYALGFLMALAVAAVLRRSLVKGGGATFVLEMPPYRLPRLRNIGRLLVHRAWDFVTQTGTIIVALSVVLWALMSFPRQGLDPAEHARRMQAIVLATPENTRPRTVALAHLQGEDERLQLENSIAGRLGHAVEPLIEPLGFDWRIGIGLIGSFAAREVLVPVMSQVYGKGSQADVDDRYAAEVGRTMAASGSLTPLKGLSLMVFFAIAMQCLNTVATIRRETDSWRWAGFSIVYLNGLAWLASLLVYQGGRALGFQ